MEKLDSLSPLRIGFETYVENLYRLQDKAISKAWK